MARHALVLLFTVSFLLCHIVVIAADADPFKTLLSSEGCVAIDDTYVPKKLRDTIRVKDDNRVSMFEGKDIFQIMDAYNSDIDENIKVAAKPNNKSFYTALDCARNLNNTEAKLISKWYGDSLAKAVKDHAANELATNFLSGIQTAASSSICKHYNEIALQFERRGLPDEAEEIYRTVLRNYAHITGCSKEAEISLQTLRRK